MILAIVTNVTNRYICYWCCTSAAADAMIIVAAVTCVAVVVPFTHATATVLAA